MFNTTCYIPLLQAVSESVVSNYSQVEQKQIL